MGRGYRSIFASFCSTNKTITNNQFNNKISTLALSLPNATVVEFTIHCQKRPQSKFKGTVDSYLFLTVIRTQIILLYFKMFTRHNNIVYGGIRNYLYKNGLYTNVCNVIKFRGKKKYRKHVHRDDIQDALTLHLL